MKEAIVVDNLPTNISLRGLSSLQNGDLVMTVISPKLFMLPLFRITGLIYESAVK